MKNDNQVQPKAFIHIAKLYAREYARGKYPETDSRRFGGIGFGHADNVFEALKIRHALASDLKKSAEGLTRKDLEVIAAQVLTGFDYTRQFEDPASGSEGCPIEYIIIDDFYDRAEIAELMAEAVAIALGENNLAIPVDERFGTPLPRPPSPAYGGRLARYKAWLGS